MPEGCRHGTHTHTNGTAYIRGTYGLLESTHKHTHTHTHSAARQSTQQAFFRTVLCRAALCAFVCVCVCVCVCLGVYSRVDASYAGRPICVCAGGLMHKSTTHSAARGRAPHSGIVGKTGPAARVCFAGRSGEALNYTTGNYLSGMPHSSYHVPGLASEENFTPSPHACQLRVARVAATSQFKTLSVPPRRAPNQCGHNSE